MKDLRYDNVHEICPQILRYAQDDKRGALDDRLVSLPRFFAGAQNDSRGARDGRKERSGMEEEMREGEL